MNRYQRLAAAMRAAVETPEKTIPVIFEQTVSFGVGLEFLRKRPARMDMESFWGQDPGDALSERLRIFRGLGPDESITLKE